MNLAYVNPAADRDILRTIRFHKVCLIFKNLIIFLLINPVALIKKEEIRGIVVTKMMKVFIINVFVFNNITNTLPIKDVEIQRNVVVILAIYTLAATVSCLQVLWIYVEVAMFISYPLVIMVAIVCNYEFYMAFKFIKILEPISLRNAIKISNEPHIVDAYKKRIRLRASATGAVIQVILSIYSILYEVSIGPCQDGDYNIVPTQSYYTSIATALNLALAALLSLKLDDENVTQRQIAMFLTGFLLAADMFVFSYFIAKKPYFYLMSIDLLVAIPFYAYVFYLLMTEYLTLGSGLKDKLEALAIRESKGGRKI